MLRNLLIIKSQLINIGRGHDPKTRNVLDLKTVKEGERDHALEADQKTEGELGLALNLGRGVAHGHGHVLGRKKEEVAQGIDNESVLALAPEVKGEVVLAPEVVEIVLGLEVVGEIVLAPEVVGEVVLVREVVEGAVLEIENLAPDQNQGIGEEDLLQDTCRVLLD